MVTVSYPGVYIQEVPSGVNTITGVATSIAAFFGRTAKGPLNKAVRVLSPADFTRTFGGPHPSSDLATSVTQFFSNGGTDCYVVRLAQNARKADVTLRDLNDSVNVLTATAKAEGVWGNGIRLVVDYNTSNPDDTFNLQVIYEEGGVVVSQEQFTSLSMQPTSPRFAPTFVSQSSELIDLTLHSDLGDPNSATSFINTIANTPAGYSQSRRPFDTSSVAGLVAALTGLFTANGSFDLSLNGQPSVGIDLSDLDLSGATTLTDVADLIAGEITLQLSAQIPGASVTCQWDAIGDGSLDLHVLRITSNVEPFTSVHVQRTSSSDLSVAMMLGLEQGGIEVVRYSNLRPVFNGSAYVGGNLFGDFTDGVDALAGLLNTSTTNITINGSAAVTFDLTDGSTTRWYEQPGGGFDGVRERLRLIAEAVTNEATVPWRGEVWGYHLVFLKQSGSLNDAASAIVSAGESTLGDGFVANNVRQYTLGNTGTSPYQSLSTDASGEGTLGSDGVAPGVSEYQGSELLQTGFHALDPVDLFNLMVIPGDTDVTETQLESIWASAATYCKDHRAFLVIDAPASWSSNSRPTVVQNTALINSFRALLGNAKDHAAIFYPRLLYRENGLTKSIGPAGAITGLMSRTDATRGVWKAPAGTEASLNGFVGMEVNLTDPENGVLNKQAVNCLRTFPSGFVNWGARTMAGFDDNANSDWKYIPIRRLALFLEESLFRGTKWVVFEPNDEPLWAQIRLNLTVFMMGLFRQGAFQGSTPDQAFYVKCDGETTTQADRNLGIVNIEVGFAPLKPAEFVIIKIQQIAGDLL